MAIKRTVIGAAVLIATFWAPMEALYGQAITESVDDRRTIRLPDTTHSRTRRARDNGRVAADLPMERVILLLKSSPEQEADLEQFLAQQQDPSSTHYHEWLTPQQFAERFGASPEDIGVIVKWLQSHGLRVTGVSNGRREIEFSGTARQVERAFQTEIHRYEWNGEMHVANAIDISIPQALATVVEGIASLHDFDSKPRLHFWRPAANLRDGSHAIVPYDFATIYNVAPLWNQGFDGGGQSIAVVGRSNINLNDVVTFRADYGLPAKDPDVIVNGPDPGILNEDEESEALLDVEWSGAVAKGATIKFVVSKSTNTSDGAFLSALYSINNNIAPVLSVSFGFCEAGSSSQSRAVASLWQQAAAQGISVFVSSGDSGSAGCDEPSSSKAAVGFGVNGAASTPYNVAVGGTQFNENGADSVYWNSTNNASNRSSAKTYIPEAVWNESGPDGLWSGGGGVSTLHSTPSWQTGFGVPPADPGATSQHHRYVPDISLTAATQHDGYVIQQGGKLYLAGGTSASAPAFAGIMAIVNQITDRANGNPNPRLYALAAEVPSAFHDVSAGTNAVPCVLGSRDCADGTMSGFSAGPGYDLATGWGSVDAYVLAHAWASSAVPPSPVSITSSSSLTGGSTGTSYTLTLAASGGTPPYRWTVTAGSLPPGLTLSTGGVLSGVPTTSGTFNFTAQVTDTAEGTVSQSFQITIVVAPSATASSATAATYHVFPQFADGRLSDGTYYRTTLMITNPNASAGATCTLQLRGLTVAGFGSNYSLAAGGWTIASTSGTQTFQSGYATLQCTANVEAQLLYSYYLSNGTKVSEATVFSSPPASAVRVLADERESAQLGLAIANDSDQSVTYTITVSGASGPGTVTLGPKSSTAKFISQFVSGIPANNLGLVQVSSSNGTASVIGLRYTGLVFTTIPESIRSSVGATASTYHIFPQFSDGKFGDGSYYRTTRMYINPNSSATAECTTQLRGVTTDGNNRFTASLPPGGAVIAPTNGTQSFQSGYATMQCSSSVDAQALYSYYSANGMKLSEATVFSSPAAKTVQILADSREGAQVGLAIANDSDQTNTYTISVRDANGALVGSATQTLGPRSSLAKFISQFVTLPRNHVGTVTVTSDTGTASIIGLRYTGNVFTTIPEAIRP